MSNVFVIAPTCQYCEALLDSADEFGRGIGKCPNVKCPKTLELLARPSELHPNLRCVGFPNRRCGQTVSDNVTCDNSNTSRSKRICNNCTNVFTLFHLPDPTKNSLQRPAQQ